MIVTINIDNCIREMPGSNYSFTSGANTGLTFSGNDDAEEPVESKSPMRMAGEVFSNQNDTSNSSVDTPKETTGSWWRNQYSDMNSSGSSNSDSDANSLENRNSTPPGGSASQSQNGLVYKANEETPEAAAARASQQQQAQDKLTNRAAELAASYDPDKYKYYESPSGKTGASAYAEQMAQYEGMVQQNNEMGGNHLGLVAQMMHPDWQDHNFNGTYGQINQNSDYSQAPTGAAYGPGGKKEGIFGASGSSAGQPKGKY
jgi:hypothetical protein